MKEAAPNEKLAKAAFAAMAFASVVAGLTLHLLQARIGISKDAAQLISMTFVLVGIADTIVLLLWDRIFRRRG